MSPGPSLFRHQMVLKAQEYFGREILSLLSAKRADDHNRLERELSDTGGHVVSAPLTGDYKLPSAWCQKSHDQSSIREYKAKVDVQNGNSAQPLNSQSGVVLARPERTLKIFDTASSLFPAPLPCGLRRVGASSVFGPSGLSRYSSSGCWSLNARWPFLNPSQ
jgi:hypothetical protein